MTRRQRLDAELVRRGLARSREQAAGLVDEQRVLVAGMVATKAATAVGTDAAVVVLPPADPERVDYVSRGGHKLAGALRALPELRVDGRRCLDAGASTGGFTDVLLRAGAAAVAAVDVGYGQLAWSLRRDGRVTVHDRTNVRAVEPVELGGPVDLVVADLSFISLRLVLPVLSRACRDDGDQLLLVKPQFEVGRDRIGRGGVVREPAAHGDAVLAVSVAAAGLGWGSRAVTASPLPGAAGNVEYFVWLQRAAPPPERAAVDSAVRAGPAGERLQQ